MKNITLTCDIENMIHSGEVKHHNDYIVIFDHDQEDGKSKVDPYFQEVDIDICANCMKYIFENKRHIYAFGAMGYNKYYLN